MGLDRWLHEQFADVELEREQMHAYQRDIMLPFVMKNPFSALFADMGLGKSITMATLIVDLIVEGHKGKILVVGPLRVMTDTWPTEFRTWRHTAAFTPVILREDDKDPRIVEARRRDRANGAARAWDRETLEMQGLDEADIRAKLGATEEWKARELVRGELAGSNSTIHFINREQLVWLVNFHGRRWPYRTVIIDESSGFKDHRTERFKALKKVRRTEGLITRLHELTATPAAETYEHLFAQIYLLDLGKRLGTFITHYREEYFTYNKWTMKWTVRSESAAQEILDKIKDVCLVMQAKDYLSLEEPTIVPRKVTLDEKSMAVYQSMKEEGIVTLADGATVSADSAAALSSKLLQIASGVLYETYEHEDSMSGEYKKVKRVHRIHEAKLDTLREIYEGLEGRPVLVAYHFKSSLDRLKKAFPKAVVMDREGKCVKDWNAGKIPMLLMHPQSGGHGLNLQKGGHNMVFYDLIWSLELWLQFIGRLARQGQKNPVLVQVLVAVGTYDELVLAALMGKKDAQDQLFTMLKRLIRRYRERREQAAAA